MLSLPSLGASINDHPDGVICAVALPVSRNAKANSPGVAGAEPNVCVYPVTELAVLCQAVEPSWATDVPSPDTSITWNCE